MKLLDLLAAAGLLVTTAALPKARSVIENRRYTTVSRDIEYNVFEHAGTSTAMSYVKNSGICETTPGVNQYSGYLSVGEWAAPRM